MSQCIELWQQDKSEAFVCVVEMENNNRIVVMIS